MFGIGGALGKLLDIGSIALPFVAPSVPSVSTDAFGGATGDWMPNDFSSVGSWAPNDFASTTSALGPLTMDLASNAEYGFADPSSSFSALGGLGQQGGFSSFPAVPDWAKMMGTRFAIDALARTMMPQPQQIAMPPMPPGGYGAPTPQGSYLQRMALQRQQGQDTPGAVWPWNVLEGYGLQPGQYCGLQNHQQTSV